MFLVVAMGIVMADTRRGSRQAGRSALLEIYLVQSQVDFSVGRQYLSRQL